MPLVISNEIYNVDISEDINRFKGRGGLEVSAFYNADIAIDYAQIGR
jgi:hypothetical protein